jgi:hypothetical protein
LIRFVDKALAYDKTARFADAATMQHALRVTFAELSGGSVSDAQRLEIPDLQSIPASRAITLRNLKAPNLGSVSGQPTAARARESRQPLYLAAAGAAVLLLVLIWAFARRAGTGAGGAEVAVAASATVAPSGAGGGGSPPRTSAAEPEPKAVRLDDLPQEPRAPAAHKSGADGASKRR